MTHASHTSSRFLVGLLGAFLVVGGIVHCNGSSTSQGSGPQGDASSDDASMQADGDDGGSAADTQTEGKAEAGPTCGASCDGCCNGARCEPSSDTTCGSHGSACASCANAGTGHTCVAGQCGCGSSSDCPASTVCDPNTNRCGAPCSAQNPCATGCCSASGICAAGTDGKACGAGGTCADCSQNAGGTGCVSGKMCGCNGPSDCAFGQACDPVAHTCTATCSDMAPCNGECCVAGACTTTCTGNPNGSQCVGQNGVYQCGCFGLTDCAADEACDSTKHACTTACDTQMQPCNGGCCNNGTCAAGTSDAVCGGVMPNSNLVGMCTSCASSLIGGHCAYSGGQGDYACGTCSTNGDCNAPATCQNSQCCLPSGATGDPNNPQFCCSDVVANGVCQ
jgi:hypothetical protein